jgi:N-acetylneuraminic acid mutarotase
MYLAGGQNAAGELTRTLYAYNSSTNIWTTKANMPAAGGCGGSAVIAGKLYVFSGCKLLSTGAQDAAGLLHRYNPATNSWVTLHAAPVAHFQPAVGAIGGKLYVAGGNVAGAASRRLDVYDPATNTWTTKAAMPTARVAMAATVLGGKLYVVGGRNGTNYLDAVESYDPLSNAWSRRAAMISPRAGTGAGAIGQFIYLVGGRNASNVLAFNERYTP